MAAFDTPWLSHMSKSAKYSSDTNATSPANSYDPNPPTVAAFSPSNASGYSASAKQRSTIIVHKKSPLLVATPPQVTRALAHSHPFLLPLNTFLGLLSWSNDDPWESFLMLAAFWAVTLYGTEILQYGGPIILVTFIILGMYSRRYSPLSSTLKTGEKISHKRHVSESPQHKSLDEIVDALNEFTSRCNILLEPFLIMTDFLSTQRTATSATTRPALTTMFIRILLVTPFWIILTLRPIHILTTRRVVLAVGTIILSWHSRPARITRVVLWRSLFLRRTASAITGLHFGTPDKTVPVSLLRSPTAPRRKSQVNLAAEVATTSRSPGVRFTFILYENQRRWLGLGWTTSLFAYERGPWTDEHLNPAPSKDEFELPEVEGGIAKWRWTDASDWHIENGDLKSTKQTPSKTSTPPPSDGGGWIYYDNKWNDPRNTDSWGRYTRRRKWYRDAELVEITPSTENSPPTSPVPAAGAFSDIDDSESERIRKAKEYGAGLHTPSQGTGMSMTDSTATIRPATPQRTFSNHSTASTTATHNLTDDPASTKKKKSGWFSRRNRSDSKSSSGRNTAHTNMSERSGYSRDGPENDKFDRWRDSGGGAQGRMSIGEDVAMSLG